MSAPIGISVRVSRKGDREDERFHSPKEQVDRATALVIAKGYTPGPVFEDINVSGATAPADRPGMSALLAAIDRGELGGVAAFSLDRLSREPAHGDALVKRVTKAGGVILTPDIPDAIDSPTGEFTFGMLLQVAKLYRSQAGARFASAKERSIAAGIPVGPPPFGYRRGPDRRLELDPEAAGLVRDLYERRARGEGPAELARWMTERTGRAWVRQGIRFILQNRIYATGRLQYGDLVSPHSAGAIVDEALWQAVQRARPKPRGGRNPTDPWLLTGLVKCATCGYNLRPHSTSARYNGGRQYRRYHCNNDRCEGRVSIQARLLEPGVLRQTARVAHELRRHSTAPDLGALEEALAVAERRLEQVMAPEARDALGGLWAADVKARRVERDDVAAELGMARQTACDADESVVDLLAVWDDLTPVARRDTLALFWREIRVGRRGPGGFPMTYVSRGHGSAEIDLPTTTEEAA